MTGSINDFNPKGFKVENELKKCQKISLTWGIRKKIDSVHVIGPPIDLENMDMSQRTNKKNKADNFFKGLDDEPLNEDPFKKERNLVEDGDDDTLNLDKFQSKKAILIGF